MFLYTGGKHNILESDSEEEDISEQVWLFLYIQLMRALLGQPGRGVGSIEFCIKFYTCNLKNGGAGFLLKNLNYHAKVPKMGFSDFVKNCRSTCFGPFE